jgi:hypothetical protein
MPAIREKPKKVSPRIRTWKVVRWDKPAEAVVGEPVELQCDCGREALCPTAGPQDFVVIARIGARGLILDPNNTPPTWWMPQEIQCRHCLRIYQ